MEKILYDQMDWAGIEEIVYSESKAIRKKHVRQYATSIPSIPPRGQFFL